VTVNDDPATCSTVTVRADGTADVTVAPVASLAIHVNAKA
jgi:hypothetical protein